MERTISHFARTICAVGLVLMGALGSTSAVAQDAGDSCGPHRTTILQLADRIIAERGQAEGFAKRNFGSTAAYLILRYGDVDFASGMNMLVRVEQGTKRGPRGINDVRLAFAVSKLGVKDGLAINGRAPAEVIAEYAPSVVRQVILADAGESFFRLLEEVRADPALAESFAARYNGGLSIYGWVLDQSDEVKLELARHAEAAGELNIAAFVLGSRRDLAEYFALLERHKNTDLAERAGPKWLNAYLATILHQTEPVPVPGDDAEAQAYRQGQFDIMSAAFRMGGFAWLGIHYNQTGADEPIAKASRAFLAELEAGRLNPDVETEAAWVFLYEQLAQEMGVGAVQNSLSSFSIPSGVRHYADRAQTTLEWMIARQALIPYLIGKAADLPERPEHVSSEFDWAAWTETATAVRTGGGSAASSDLRIVVELMLAKEDVMGAIDVAKGIMPHTDRLQFYRDVMLRLDRRCEGYTSLPGGELMLGGMILYRFDQRP